ncbi:DUF1990 family protein [Streptomyces sp. 8N706]|uniref:DUF1990 family protein n=1 Tax=Streptomyces sp. 8N706 TaxID=3457416 RepID=UPI003FD30D2E
MTRDRHRAHRTACGQQLTYSQAGATLEGPLPAGYTHLRRRIRLGSGQELYERAGAYVLAWGAQRGAGFEVHPGSSPAPGDTVIVTARPPGLRFPRLLIPCRVVWAMSGPRRTGFAYGTLPGHPESGEESFTVTLDERGGVWFAVTAFSRPGNWYTRWGGPVGRLVQRAAAERYLRAVAAAVGSR